MQGNEKSLTNDRPYPLPKLVVKGNHEFLQTILEQNREFCQTISETNNDYH